jgi:hypothetical protein
MATGPESAAKQLERVLGFFSRAEAKSAFASGLVTAMLTVLVADLDKIIALASWQVPCVIFLYFVCRIYYQVYWIQAPNLAGGTGSLIYFREISKLREEEYVQGFTALDEQALAKQILEQVWRNSVILAKKFDSVDRAYGYIKYALPFWVATLVLLRFQHVAK